MNELINELSPYRFLSNEFGMYHLLIEQVSTVSSLSSNRTKLGGLSKETGLVPSLVISKVLHGGNCRKMNELFTLNKKRRQIG
jgi:hypothetical protein